MHDAFRLYIYNLAQEWKYIEKHNYKNIRQFVTRTE